MDQFNSGTHCGMCNGMKPVVLNHDPTPTQECDLLKLFWLPGIDCKTYTIAIFGKGQKTHHGNSFCLSLTLPYYRDVQTF